MAHRPVPVLHDLVQSVAALVRESAAGGAALADRLPANAPRQRAAEEWFLECVSRLAADTRTAYASPSDALLSVRQQVRVALEASMLSVDQRERILVLATEAAMDALFDQSGLTRNPRAH